MSVMKMFSLEGKVALVTGGAGMFGRQIATALSQAGASTHMTSRSREKLSEIEQSFRDEGVEVKAHYYDQEEEASILALRDTLLEQHGKVDILVNNAVARTMSSWDDPLEAFAKSMQINAVGLYAVTRAFGDEMVKRGEGGSIINIGSIQGMVGPDGALYKDLGFHGFVPDYFFHKGGMVNFTRFVASYYGPHQIRCNCLSPGGLASHRTPPEFIERYSERTLLQRMAGDSDLMGSIVYLASDASAYVTGTNLVVDGGYTAK